VRRRVFCVAAGASALLFASAAGARAQDAASGYAGKGNFVAQTTVSTRGTMLSFGGTFAVEAHGSRMRLDVLSLGIAGMGASTAALLSATLSPPGGFTVVYDLKTGSFTLWSSAKRTYFTKIMTHATGASAVPANGATAAPANGATAAPTNGASAAPATPFGFARSLANDSAFSLSLALAGHGTVNGHPATGLDYHYARTANTGDAIDVQGRLQLADDLDGLPVEITASGTTRSLPKSSITIDLTTLAKGTPPDGDFAVPAGFTRVNDVFGVLGKTLPGT
jgi:hypothetical protein